MDLLTIVILFGGLLLMKADGVRAIRYQVLDVTLTDRHTGQKHTWKKTDKYHKNTYYLVKEEYK